MEISDQELRALVRDAIARHGGAPAGSAASGGARGLTVVSAHVSHGRFPLASGGDEGQCVIEPAVRCNHCGYCQSLGH